MNRANNILKNLIFYTRNNSLNPPKSRIDSICTSTARSGLRFHSSESDSSNKPNVNQTQKPGSSAEPEPEDVEVVSDQELKKKIERFYDGNEDEIPSIFEAILKRKLAGISDDHNLMESLGSSKVKDVEDEDEDEDDDDYDLHTGSDSESESELDSD